MSLKSCFHHLPRRFGHVSRYRQGQAVVVGLAKPQSVAYAALLLYGWLAVAPSDELRGTYRNRTGAGLVRSVAFCERYYDLAEQRDIFSHFSDLAEHDAPKYGAGFIPMKSNPKALWRWFKGTLRPVFGATLAFGL